MNRTARAVTNSKVRRNMRIVISNQSELPIYAQIKEQVKEQILNGLINEGTVLPSIRQLAKELGVSVTWALSRAARSVASIMWARRVSSASSSMPGRV